MQNAVVSAAVAGLIALAGCAMVSSHDVGPNGRPVHYIDGMTAGATFRKAAELCPGGYNMLSAPTPTTAFDYVVTIECK